MISHLILYLLKKYSTENLKENFFFLCSNEKYVPFYWSKWDLLVSFHSLQWAFRRHHWNKWETLLYCRFSSKDNQCSLRLKETLYYVSRKFSNLTFANIVPNNFIEPECFWRDPLEFLEKSHFFFISQYFHLNYKKSHIPTPFKITTTYFYLLVLINRSAPPWGASE